MMNKGLRGLRVKANEMGDPLTFVTFGLTIEIPFQKRHNALECPRVLNEK
jgi:ribosomal protein L16/L10AE